MSLHWNGHPASVYVLLIVANIDPLFEFLFLDSGVLGGLPMDKGIVGLMIIKELKGVVGLMIITELKGLLDS